MNILQEQTDIEIDVISNILNVDLDIFKIELETVDFLDCKEYNIILSIKDTSQKFVEFSVEKKWVKILRDVYQSSPFDEERKNEVFDNHFQEIKSLFGFISNYDIKKILFNDFHKIGQNNSDEYVFSDDYEYICYKPISDENMFHDYLGFFQIHLLYDNNEVFFKKLNTYYFLKEVFIDLQEFLNKDDIYYLMNHSLIHEIYKIKENKEFFKSNLQIENGKLTEESKYLLDMSYKQ